MICADWITSASSPKAEEHRGYMCVFTALIDSGTGQSDNTYLNSYLSSAAAAITLTFKSLKPPKSFSLSVQTTDTIQSIKGQLASQSSAPPADIQRLLLKGKALADTKLLKEYTIKDGDTVNLMIKPGHIWDPNSTTDTNTAMPSTPSPAPALQPDAKPTLGHTRIPSVVLSPSPSATTPSLEVDQPLDINLTLDTSQTLPSAQPAQSTYHATIAEPGFWGRLNDFLKCVYFLMIHFFKRHSC